MLVELALIVTVFTTGASTVITSGALVATDEVTQDAVLVI
jgi:hypothetical protein